MRQRSGPVRSPAEEVVKDIRRATRRHFSAEEKIRIVLEGLRGEEIPLAARIFSVVDVWDALITVRVYKPAWPEPEVLNYLREVAGSQLDPDLVALFLENYDGLKALGRLNKAESAVA